VDFGAFIADWNAETDEGEGVAGEDCVIDIPDNIGCEICPNNPEMGEAAAIFL
jgi:hypothetical protein